MRTVKIGNQELSIPLIQGGMGIGISRCNLAGAVAKNGGAIIHSPVGVPGRVIRNAFVERMEAGQERISGCYNRLKVCNPKTAAYCISQARINAVKGDLEHGLIFCGAKVGDIKK